MKIMDRTLASVSFKILPEKELLLESLALIDWNQPDSFPGCIRLKHSSARTVYHLTTQQILLKIFRPVTLLDKIRFSFFSSKAQLEFEAMLFAQTQQLSTSVPIGFGTDPFQKSYLLIEAIPNVQPFDRVFSERYTSTKRSQRNEILQHVALLIARMHQSGILHADFHAGNILWSESEKKAWIIDLYHYQKNPALRRKACLQNLVIFNRVFQLKASRTDRLRFFRAYHTAFPQHPQWKQDCLWLEQQTSRSNLQFWKHRERRCLKENKYFGRVACQEYTGFAKKNPLQGNFELPPNVWNSILELLQNNGEQTLPSGAVWIKAKSRTTRVLKITHENQIYYVKQYCPQSFGYQLKSLLRSSRARNAWLLGYALLTRGLLTGEPVLVLEKKRFGLLVDSMVVVKEIPDFRETLLPEVFEQRQQHLDRFARVFRHFHDRGFSHRDLKGPNLLWGKEGLYFLDLDGVRRSPPSPKVRCRDLGRFLYWFTEETAGPPMSSAEKEHFLRRYFYSFPALISPAKEQYYFQRIQQYLEKKSKQRHQKRKGARS